MFTGMTLANLIGVPIGTYVGHNFSWRITYGIISLLGLITFFALLFWMPKFIKNQNQFIQTIGLFQKMAILVINSDYFYRNWRFICLDFLHCSFGNRDFRSSSQPSFYHHGFGWTWYGDWKFVGRKLADTINPIKATIINFSAMVICLIVVHFTAQYHSMAYVMAFVTGMISFSVGTPIQMMLIQDAKGAETFAASAGQASFNLGNTLGAYFGSVPITLGFAYDTPVLVGAGMASIGVMLTYAFLKVKSNATKTA